MAPMEFSKKLTLFYSCQAGLPEGHPELTYEYDHA